MNIEKEIKILKDKENDYYQRAAAYSALVSYFEKQLEDSELKKETYMMTAQNYLNKSKNKYILLEFQGNNTMISRAKNLSIKNIADAILKLKQFKSALEEQQKETEELKTRVEKI